MFGLLTTTRVFFILALTAIIPNLRANQETIISVSSPDDAPQGCLVIFNGQGYRVGWTQPDRYVSVDITAKLYSVASSNITCRAFLTTQIGSGTTTNHEIASTTFTLPVEITDVVLFQGLELPAGTYYLSIIGDMPVGSCWKNGFSDAITAPGVEHLVGFGAAGPLSSYFPATPTYEEETKTEFTVHGINIDHPMLRISKTNELFTLSWSQHAADFVLESGNGLAPTDWQAISSGITTNAQNLFFSTNAQSTQFFRLKKASD